MSIKKIIKQKADERLEEETPKVESLENPSLAPTKAFPWKWVAIPTAVCAMAVGGTFAVLKLTAKPSTKNGLDQEAIVLPKKRTMTTTISDRCAAIYKGFAEKIAPVALKTNFTNQSVAFSAVDAFVSLSMEVYLSADAIQSAYCQSLGARDMAEVNETVKEISTYLGVAGERSLGEETGVTTGLFGGANINSLWLAPGLRLKSGIDPLLKELSDSYFVSVYHVPPTAANLNVWFQSVAPEGFDELPEIKVPDDSNASCVSAYFLQDHYQDGAQVVLKQQYDSKNHYLDYTLADGTTKKVDYIKNVEDTGTVYTGDGFTAADQKIAATQFHYCLPDPGKTPMDILDAALSREGLTSKKYKLTTEAPYFKINSDLDITSTVETLGISELKSASLTKLVDDSEEYLDVIKQDSLLTYDYRGFYAASATVVANTGEAEPPKYDPYTFSLNRPYYFESDLYGLPVFYGIVMDPGYPAAA